jgi:hypothetical protein
MIGVTDNAHEKGPHLVDGTDFVVRLAIDGDFFSRSGCI